LTAVATEPPAAAAIATAAIAAIATIGGRRFGAAAERHQKNHAVHLTYLLQAKGANPIVDEATQRLRAFGRLAFRFSEVKLQRATDMVSFLVKKLFIHTTQMDFMILTSLRITRREKGLADVVGQETKSGFL
jgi:hypothetical protein